MLFNQDGRQRPDIVVSDTGSYSDLVFGLVTLLGVQYRPALADLPDQKGWRISPSADYGPLNAFARGKIDLGRIPAHCSVVKSIVGLKCVGSGELAGGASVLRKRRAGSDADDAVLAHLAQSPRDARGAYRCGEPMRRLRLLRAAGKTGMAVIAGGAGRSQCAKRSHDVAARNPVQRAG